jgi:hypothetical protein
MQPAKRKRLEEIRARLRSLEREGLVISRLGSDGQVRWYITEKGSREEPDEANVRLDLDS